MAVLTKNIAESLSFSEGVVKRPTKRVAVLLSFVEGLTKSFSKNVTETLVMTGTIRRNGNLPIFDAMFNSLVLTREELANLADSPNVGYTNFQSFYPADYTFQKAIGGIRVTGAINSGRAGIASLTHVVDVEDVTERGEATIADAGTTRITFLKIFTQPPEVVVAFKSGLTLGIPRVVAITKTYVDIELYDIGSSQIEGVITYAAIGY